MSPVRRSATVSGRVQGVSFRYYAEREAGRLGLVGWVRNAADGTVRLEVQGPGEAVSEFVSWLRQGPPTARVDAVEIDDIEVRDGEDAFRTVR